MSLTVALERPSGSVVAAWDALADELDASPFARPGWVLTLAEAFFGRPPSLLCVRRGEQIVGVAPVCRRGGTLRSPTNWHTPLFAVLAENEAAHLELARALLEAAPARLDLSFLDAGDPALRALAESGERDRRRTIRRTILRSPYVELTGRSWEAYEASLPSKVRKETRRLQRRLSEQGVVEFEFSDGTERLETLLEEGFALEGSGWKQRNGTAINSHPKIQAFHAEIARWAAARGELRLCFLRLDGCAIAFDFCLQSAGVVYALKGGFDPAFRRYGPGMLLTHETLRRAFAHGLHSYELLGDADPYKLTWTQTLRERERLQAFNLRSPAGLAGWLAWGYGRSAVGHLRELTLAARARKR